MFSELSVSIYMALIGLITVLAKKMSPFVKFMFLITSMSLFITIEKSSLFGLVFFLTFFPVVLMQRVRKHTLRIKSRSTIIQKILGYLGVLPLFGLVFIFKENVEVLFVNWSFPNSALFPLEVGLIVITVYWTIEWTLGNRRTRF